MQRCVYPVAQYQGVPRWLGRASYPIDYRQLYSKRTKKNEISKAVRRSEGEKKDIEKSKRWDRGNFRKNEQSKNIYGAL